MGGLYEAKTCKVAENSIDSVALCRSDGRFGADRCIGSGCTVRTACWGTETDTEAGTEGNTQSTGSVSDGNVVIKEREETGTESGAPQADSVSEGDGIALISLEASNTHIATYTGKFRKESHGLQM